MTVDLDGWLCLFHDTDKGVLTNNILLVGAFRCKNIVTRVKPKHSI